MRQVFTLRIEDTPNKDQHDIAGDVMLTLSLR